MTEQSKQSESVEVIAKTIIEEMIQYEAWRDGIVVNDLPFLKSRIAKALQAERTVQAGLEADRDLWKANFERFEVNIGQEREWRRQLEAERDALKVEVERLKAMSGAPTKEEIFHSMKDYFNREKLVAYERGVADAKFLTKKNCELIEEGIALKKVVGELVKALQQIQQDYPCGRGIPCASCTAGKALAVAQAWVKEESGQLKDKVGE